MLGGGWMFPPNRRFRDLTENTRRNNITGIELTQPDRGRNHCVKMKSQIPVHNTKAHYYIPADLYMNEIANLN